MSLLSKIAYHRFAIFIQITYYYRYTINSSIKDKLSKLFLRYYVPGTVTCPAGILKAAV